MSELCTTANEALTEASRQELNLTSLEKEIEALGPSDSLVFLCSAELASRHFDSPQVQKTCVDGQLREVHLRFHGMPDWVTKDDLLPPRGWALFREEDVFGSPLPSSLAGLWGAG